MNISYTQKEITRTIFSFKDELSAELKSILEWWMNEMVDEDLGGFYGRIDGNNVLHPKAEKGLILNTRILWSFAAAYHLLSEAHYKKIADRAFDYLLDNFWDDTTQGLFWMLDATGKPTNTKKQVYGQAFGIYAFAEYYSISEDHRALEHALKLFDCIEQYSFDSTYGGYLEAFTGDWHPIADLRLSEKDANEAKTMNTHLHIMEAYTRLYEVRKDSKVEAALRKLIQDFLERFIHPQTKHLHLFFDEQWNVKSTAVSYGHDIECSWLLYEAAEVLGDDLLKEKVEKIALEIAEITLDEAIDETGGVIYESENRHQDKEKHWWVQAEAVVGFFNALELSGKKKYLTASLNCWTFIQQKILDRIYGEWKWSVTKDNLTNVTEDKAGAWKAPYHNSRMCIEIIKRVEKHFLL
ncbi:MAG: AGE family epimerase/isomerase [Bacteroidota bacterium]